MTEGGGPGAHGAQPPLGTACLSCGHPLAGQWCSRCGQKWVSGEPTWHDLVHEATHEFLHLDGKIVHTFWSLITRPGELTAEHLRGRRAPYIGPLRLYLTMSLVYFLLVAVVPNADFNKESTVSVPANVLAAADTAHADDVVGRLSAGRRIAFARPDVFASSVTHAIPRAEFALVPLFALVMSVVFKRLGRRYSAFLYLSLHFHAAVFAYFAFVILLQPFASDLWLAAADAIVSIAAFIYLVVAIRRVFGGALGATVWRAALAAAIHACVFVALIALVIAYEFYQLGGPGASH